MSFVIFLLLVLGLVVPGAREVYGQKGGLKYFQDYIPLEGQMQPQNWDILQDRRGFIYAANQGGLLQYDGVSWRDIDIPNQSARSLAIDEKGRIYVGGRNEFGFLAPGAKGTLQYVSLLEHIDERKGNFGNVWRTHATKEGIYFCTYKLIFRWNPHTHRLRIWEPGGQFSSTSFTCRGNLFIRLQKVGLVKMERDSLVPVPGGEIFAEMGIRLVAPYDPGSQKLLIGTTSKGLFLYDGLAAAPFPTEADDYLKENSLYYGTRISSPFPGASPDRFALATKLGGLVIIDSRGNLTNTFNKDSGLRDDNVRYVFEDSAGNLWLALNDGLAKIEYASPISFYDAECSNLPGIVLSVIRQERDKTLYAGTTSGLYRLTPDGTFRPVPGIPGLCWSLVSHDDWLLAATTYGVFRVKKNVATRVIENNSYILSCSGVDTSRIWVGTARGLTSLYLKGKKWLKEHQLANITIGIRTIVEEKKGSLWLGTLAGSVLKVDFPAAGKLENAAVTVYGVDQGLPTGEIHAFMTADHVMFASGKGIFRFDKNNETFMPDTTLGVEFAGGPDGKWIFRIAEDKNKNIWFHSLRRNFQAIPQPEGTFLIVDKPFLRIPLIQANWIYPDPDGFSTWFATHKGLIRYDNRAKKDGLRRFPVFIRRVLVNGSPVFEGNRSGKEGEDLFPIIPYRDRNLRFRYAAPFFENEAGTLYSSRLDGYDDDWSPWTLETRKDYTNLDAGVYTFRVRAKNIYEQPSTEDAFRFKVLPPWYLTWWAFSVYAAAAFLIMYLVVKWRSWKLVRDKKQLEQIVKNRTKEVYEKNLLLEEQSEKLKEMDRVKSRFFANISHEFRTPLTLIMGPLEQALSDFPGEQKSVVSGNIQLALHNSQRLLTLINQLLDLSKLESGRMKLSTSRQDVLPFLKGLVCSFESLAVQERLDITFQAEEREVSLYFDTEKLEKVVTNLVANAVKFTPGGGKISVTAAVHPAKAGHYPGGYLEIQVIDTGVGIPEDQLPYIFDRFYQAEREASQEHRYKGTGIGLALVKELVELHHGEVSVQSTEGKGSVFFIRLPLGSSHLEPGEIGEGVESPAAAGETRKVSLHEIMGVEKVEAEVEGPVEEEQEKEKEDLKKDVVLVVEDNPDVRKYIRGPLECEYSVVEAADGEEGIEKAGKIIPDLIISDVMMPRKDGYQLCDELKKDVGTSHIPIILLTAKASEESIIEGLETGADDYITKPFNSKILLTRIKNLIDLRRGLQEKIQREMVLRPTEIAVSSVDQAFMKELKEAIENNLSDPEFGIDRLANDLYMSTATLNRKIRALTGESTNQFIQSYRLKRAAQLLKANFGNVTEVAFEVGFSSSPYFTHCFKEKFHQLPHTYLTS